MPTKHSPKPTDLPPYLRHLRHARLALWEIYLIGLILLAFTALFGLKHWP